MMIGPVVCVSSWEELAALAADHPGSPAIVDPDLNGIGAPSPPGLAERLRSLHYSPWPIIEYPCTDVQMLSATDEMAISTTRVKQCDVGDIRALELAILQNIDAQRVRQLLARVEERTPAGASRILRLFFRRAIEPHRVRDLSADFGVTERTLLRWCRQLGLPPPKRLSSLARVFTVARLLHWSKRPLSSVALALGFSNDANCHRLLRRILGSSMSRDMTRSDMNRIEEGILRELSYASPTEPIDCAMPASRRRSPKASDVYYPGSRGRRNSTVLKGLPGLRSY